MHGRSVGFTNENRPGRVKSNMTIYGDGVMCCVGMILQDR